jgi:putative endopeptidase
MNLFIRLFVVGSLLLTLTVASLFAQSTHKLDPSTFDQSAAACTDFYQYVNGGWMKANPIPSGVSLLEPRQYSE